MDTRNPKLPEGNWSAAFGSVLDSQSLLGQVFPGLSRTLFNTEQKYLGIRSILIHLLSWRKRRRVLRLIAQFRKATPRAEESLWREESRSVTACTTREEHILEY